jgi:hypothetical protein
MSNYVKSLEEQLEKLQPRLAAAEAKLEKLIAANAAIEPSWWEDEAPYGGVAEVRKKFNKSIHYFSNGIVIFAVVDYEYGLKSWGIQTHIRGGSSEKKFRTANAAMKQVEADYNAAVKAANEQPYVC